MTITIDLPEEIASQIERLAARDGQDIKSYLSQLAEYESKMLTTRDATASMEVQLEALRRQPIPQTLDDLSPRRFPPPGKTPMEMLYGQWPGDETTEELFAQLARLG